MVATGNLTYIAQVCGEDNPDCRCPYDPTIDQGQVPVLVSGDEVCTSVCVCVYVCVCVCVMCVCVCVCCGGGHGGVNARVDPDSDLPGG